MRIIEKPSLNCNSRDGHEIDMLVLHYTGMKTMQEALDRLCDPPAEVSAHYMVDEDGTVYRIVPEDMRAWHAGKAPLTTWRGYTNVNQRSIGIEIVNPGHEFGYRPFPKAQMEAVAELCKAILSRHSIPARNVVGHSDVAPSRKEDPGELFDWKWLAGQGIGLWFPERPSGQSNFVEILVRLGQLALWSLSRSFSLVPGAVETRLGNPIILVGPLPPYKEIQADLSKYGYNCPQTDVLDEPTGKVILAFQRHFFPERLTGKWDRACALRLASLLSMI